MNIAVLGPAAGWYLEDLRRAAEGLHELVPVDYRAICARASAGGFAIETGGHKLTDFAAVLVRSMPPGSLEQIVFRMDALANLAAAGVRVVNPPRAIEVAVDKYLATTRLRDAGLLVPPTAACQTAAAALTAFEELGGDVVVKPLFGSEGRGIVRVADEATATRVFTALEQVGSVLYLQKFIPHGGCDWRLLVLGDEVFGMCRRHPHDWRTNISLGAVGEPLEVTAELAEMALRSARAVGATLAGVDLLPGNDGQLYALEVNAVPGWRALAGVTGIDVARRVLASLQ